MRIAFYAPMKPPEHPVPSGDRRMAGLLLQALRLSGHAAEVASSLRSHESRGDAAAQAAIAEAGAAEAARLTRHWRQAGAADRPALWFTYHVYHKAPDHLGPAISRGLGIPYVIAEPSHAPKQASGPWAAGHRFALQAITQADALFCLTRHDREMVARLAPSERLHFLPPFLDAAPFAAAATTRERARRALAADRALNPDQPWLLAVGMMRQRDKLDSYLALAAALAQVADLRWRLLIVGDGEAREAVTAAFMPFSDRVSYLGAVSPEALPAIYAACDLYVWPAVGEAYGMATLEAQASGLAVVAGRLRGVPDVVEDGRTALLAAPGDAADFADKVRQLLTEPARRDAFGQAARRFVSERRSLAAAARQLDAVLCRLRPRHVA